MRKSRSKGEEVMKGRKGVVKGETKGVVDGLSRGVLWGSSGQCM